MRKFLIPLICAGVLGLVAVILFAQKMELPKPQSSFTQGQPAPDFTLKDQDGHDFHLADLQGSKALLIFYRGYW
jgi:cytochrome oxidase Cu insertion factor (SCO1/SenC/PrrC family)